MSNAIRCDCCGRCTPDINPKYSRDKRFFWKAYHYDSQGGSYEHLDVCEQCWIRIGKEVAERLIK